MFYKPLLPNQLLKLLFRGEVVVFAFDLALPWGACGVGDGETEAVRVLGEELLEDCRLAGTGRARYDDGASGEGIWRMVSIDCG